jgi:ABC-type dipeptide/oligopeptide/nickel transport system permease subunit
VRTGGWLAEHHGVQRFLQSRAAVGGLVIVVVLALLAIAAPLVSPHDPLVTQAGEQFQGPSLAYPFGTDEFGRDILSRTIYGGRTSLAIAGLSVVIAAIVGFPLGMIAGYFNGGLINSVFMRLTDMLLAFPAILLAMVIVAILGPGFRSVTISIAIVSIPPLARLARAAMLTQAAADYVTATRTVGATDRYIIFRAILPNCLPPILVQLALAAGSAILLEAALSFLGLGTQPPTPSWGAMLYSARSYLSQAPWYGVFPGVFIMLLILALDALSIGLRDILDPSRPR